MAELFDAAQGGERAARQAVDETARLIAIAVSNVGTVIDPSLIVLGGALFAQAEPLVHEVRKVVSRISRAPLEIVVSALGKEAPLQGSLLLASKEARQQLRLRLREARMDTVSA
jgi:glucokinase